ncbi:MAG: hypothetical protein JWO67_4891 [Streptosporangiaceae bacterium]|nr:hypothetical protein [Streptosporangiaceae bacterium]
MTSVTWDDLRVSEKMTCPSCGVHTSSTLTAYLDDRPCPDCGLPAEAASAVLTAQRRKADADLTAQLSEALIRAGKAEAEADLMQRRLAYIRDVLDGEHDDSL